MQVFTLFEVYPHKSSASRIFLGVYSNRNSAEQAWRENSKSDDNDFVILEFTLDQFEEW